MPRLLTAGQGSAPSSTQALPLAKVAPTNALTRAAQDTLARAAGRLQGPGAQPDKALARLQNQLAAHDPTSLAKALTKEVPAFLANFSLSAADASRFGTLMRAALRVGPSEVVTVVATLVAILSPRSWRRAKAFGVKLAKGGGHAILGRLGRGTPEALSSEPQVGDAAPAGEAEDVPETET
ncbi:MAG: hypothetical protein HUU26_13185 [Gemmatimonadaceae bacterium]|nr:hypothetical protein [Gemmatimonadaceae bacterium]